MCRYPAVCIPGCSTDLGSSNYSHDRFLGVVVWRRFTRNRTFLFTLAVDEKRVDLFAVKFGILIMIELGSLFQVYEVSCFCLLLLIVNRPREISIPESFRYIGVQIANKRQNAVNAMKDSG